MQHGPSEGGHVQGPSLRRRDLFVIITAPVIAAIAMTMKFPEGKNQDPPSHQKNEEKKPPEPEKLRPLNEKPFVVHMYMPTIDDPGTVEVNFLDDGFTLSIGKREFRIREINVGSSKLHPELIQTMIQAFSKQDGITDVKRDKCGDILLVSGTNTVTLPCVVFDVMCENLHKTKSAECVCGISYTMYCPSVPKGLLACKGNGQVVFDETTQPTTLASLHRQ